MWVPLGSTGKRELSCCNSGTYWMQIRLNPFTLSKIGKEKFWQVSTELGINSVVNYIFCSNEQSKISRIRGSTLSKLVDGEEIVQ